ncbi:uncharacterized protein E0L32_007225 [Thyridium curvatum]|uniref:Kri1-like C-terminal domain-containing protein n=1 Tax=Thyridium curvatum TaxID=1093900 RepID=A0A507B653_9PEZI|nr:uncharacterized protein E0L32_007225 [Thyridium curvatum]TPX12110.1 hypothetical protein E0L32_007225 [Thyridium curvatum]
MPRRSKDKAPSSSSSNEDALDHVENSSIARRDPATTSKMGGKQSLFDDAGSSSDEDSEDGGAQLADDSSSFKINEEYARRFEHNKKREERQKLEEKYGRDQANGNAAGSDSESDSSDDEDEDEEAFLLTEELNAQMSAALEAIKKKDPRIYDKESTFYKPPEEDDTAEPKEKKEKPVFLRDYHRERYMAGDTGADEDDQKPKTYAQEQDAVKQTLLAEINAAAEGDSDADSDDDGFIKRKEPKEGEALGENHVHPSRAAKVQLTELDVKNADKDPELYLSNFMASRSWAESGSKWEAFESDEGEPDDRADEFEAAYNLRFEDPDKSNEVLRSYSRSITAAKSVRREEKTGRQRQRELEKERKEAEKRERHEERARLRKLKVEEAEEKLKKIKQAAGLSGKQLNEEEWAGLLDDAWENDKWEQEMNRRFGDNYYAAADAGMDSDDDGAEAGKKKPRKPKWDDDIDIKDLVPDFEEEEARPNITLSDEEAGQDGPDEEEEEEEDDDRPSKKRKTSKDHKKDRADAKRAARQERAKIEALVDARMELDAPSALAGPSSSAAGASASGFRYRETSPQSFGLTARDILLAPSDAALNEFAGLKKLATWRDAEKKRRDRKKLGKKARLRQWRRDNFGAEYEATGPTFGFGDGDGGKGKGKAEASSSGRDKDEGGKKKRKRSKGKKSAA